MRRREGWPDYLIERFKNGKAYYSFEPPWLTKPVALGTDQKAAIAGVRLVERKRAPDPVQQVLNRIEKPVATVGEHFGWFFDTYLPGRRRRKTGRALSDGTLANYRTYLSRIEAPWGNRDIRSIDRAMVVAQLDSLPPESANRMRSMLMQFFAHARARGLRDDNPVEGTVLRDVVGHRKRLTQAGYAAIYEAAPAWLQRAMRLALLSLQRPTDLTLARIDTWDGELWWVRQRKSEGAGFGLLRIRPTLELKQSLEDCIAARLGEVGDVCPFLLCREPKKRKSAKGREHWAQISDEILSRAFAEIRESLVASPLTPNQIKEDLTADEGMPPSFYEIKALGTRLYEEAGRSVKWIQVLAGHQEESTTRIYTDRHKEKWVDVDLS